MNFVFFLAFCVFLLVVFLCFMFFSRFFETPRNSRPEHVIIFRKIPKFRPWGVLEPLKHGAQNSDALCHGPVATLRPPGGSASGSETWPGTSGSGEVMSRRFS